MSSLLLSALFSSVSALPPELGDVTWGRDFNRASARSKASGRPLLVLFDEVPGCQTCVRYGQSVLRHPLLVEAAETLFVPVAIYNNAPGSDRAVLNRFDEPAWNNPVVRLLNYKGEDLAPRLAGDYQAASLAARMQSALLKAKRPVPAWLDLVAAEGSSTTRTYLGMHCFWSGEACAGAVDGIVQTRTGWMNGTEVVEVEIVTGRERGVIEALAREKCGRSLFSDHARLTKAGRAAGLAVDRAGRFRATPQDDLHAIRNTRWRRLPMTSLQASRVNASVARGESPDRWLSPRQLRLADRLGGKRSLPDPRRSPDLATAQERLLAYLEAER